MSFPPFLCSVHYFSYFSHICTSLINFCACSSRRLSITSVTAPFETLGSKDVAAKIIRQRNDKLTKNICHQIKVSIKIICPKGKTWQEPLADICDIYYEVNHIQTGCGWCERFWIENGLSIKQLTKNYWCMLTLNYARWESLSNTWIGYFFIWYILTLQEWWSV